MLGASLRAGTLPRGGWTFLEVCGIMVAMAAIVVEDEQWPIVLVTFPSQLDDDDFTNYLGALAALRSRKAPYVIVFDIAKSQQLTPKQRKMQADYIKAEAQLRELFLKGVAFVAPTAIHRGILTAIFWLQKAPVQHQAFAKLGEAVAWARSTLKMSIAPRAGSGRFSTKDTVN
jgi:hypothetical protein